MSVLSELLGAPEPTFTFRLKELEQSGGHPKVDINLITDIKANVHKKLKELGLDPADTTGRELYQALQSLISLHDGFLAHAVGANDPSDVQDLLPRLKAAVEALDVPRSGWFIRPSVAKRLLKALPPKHVMKQLKYKSVDSMLKRESISELFAALRFAESPHWQKKLIESYKKLQPKDFETRQIEVLVLDQKRWGTLADDFVLAKQHNLTHLKELGVVAILPLPIKRLPGLSITLLPLIIYYINEIRLYSAYFKLQQVKPDFANIIVKTLLHDTEPITTLADQPIHWRTVQQHFAIHPDRHPELFEPHVQPEDLLRRSAEQLLYKLEPALKFWEDLDYAALAADGRAIPLSLMDNAVSFCNHLPYGQQATVFFQKNLWNELLRRYVGVPAHEERLIEQLNQTLMSPELAGIMSEEF